MARKPKQLKVTCSECDASWVVPKAGAGAPYRCPNCKTQGKHKTGAWKPVNNG